MWVQESSFMKKRISLKAIRSVIVSLCLLSLPGLGGCGEAKQSYHIKGTLPTTELDGEWMYLVPLKNPEGRVDSCRVVNASFSFQGSGEEMRVLRLRHLLRFRVQELLVVTEAGEIIVQCDTLGRVTGTPQNNALQAWKTERENRQRARAFLYECLQVAGGSDSVRLRKQIEALQVEEDKADQLFLQSQGENTLGRFMRPFLQPAPINEP